MDTIVYHGSPNKFDQFDYRKIRENGTSEGIGFYFTNERHIAENYGNNGYIYKVRFIGTKPLSHTDITIEKSNFKRYLRLLNNLTDYLSNWGEIDFEGYDTVLQRAIDGEYDTSDNDVDLIAGVVNACGNAEVALTLCTGVLERDCIITDAEWGGGQKIYIALSHTAYEIIDVEKHKQE